MDSDITSTWKAACAHRLQQHWRTIDPTELEAVAVEIWADPRRQESDPVAAAAAWLEPIEANSG